MDKIYDFTNDKRINRRLGGSDRKFEVEHNGVPFILKFSENHAKRTDMSTSYVNNVLSEYISSHIAASIGIPVHDTVLGVYNNVLVVGCKDFRAYDEEIMEFQEYVHAIYDSKDIGRVIQLKQIYNTLNDKSVFSNELKEASVKRYWDTFVVDALVGNFDRHIGNWGYIEKNNELRLAPTYDYGSTLLPQLSDEGMDKIVNDKFEMMKRCLVFPSPALFLLEEKVGKPGYYDLMSSNYDSNCTYAVLKIIPDVNLDNINTIIDETPLISDVRRNFYKTYLSFRKEIILDKAYEKCFAQQYDQDALYRLQNGIQFSEKMLKDMIESDIQEQQENDDIDPMLQDSDPRWQ